MARYPICKIIIQEGESGSGKSTLATSSMDSTTGRTNSSSSSSGSSSSSSTSAIKDLVNASKAIVAYSGIKQIANSYINYGISTVSLRTGATEYEQKLQFAYSEGSQALSSLGSIAIGAAVGGVAGAGVAAMGVGISYLMKFIGWSQNAQTIQYEQSLENISLSMAQIRTGSAGSRSTK